MVQCRQISVLLLCISIVGILLVGSSFLYFHNGLEWDSTHAPGRRLPVVSTRQIEEAQLVPLMNSRTMATSTISTATQQQPISSSTRISVPPPATTSSPPSTVPPSLIPKIRHLVWKNKTLPTRQSDDAFGAWMAYEPNFDHIIHDDDECLEMVKIFTEIRAKEHIKSSEVRFLTPALQQLAQRTYTYNFTQVYMDYQLNVMRADVCRVLAVYIYGGMYTDLDVYHSRSVAQWGVRWDTHDIFLVPENDVHTNNFIFGASPRHPCMRVVLEAMLREGQDPFPFRRSKHAVHHVTGPAIFTAALASCLVDSSYLALPRTLYGRRTQPAFHNITLTQKDMKFAPYTPSAHHHDSRRNNTNNTGVTFALKMALRREELWRYIRHASASISWKNAKGYKSWTDRKNSMDQKLFNGKPVDAVSERKLWPVRRARDDDEQFPTLIPKKRHVVAQRQTADELKKLQTSVALWESFEPHFTTVIHTSENCHAMAQKYKIKVDVKEEDVPDVVCGLLAVHFEGGIYMDSSLCPKTPMANWSHIVPWSTLDLLFTTDDRHNFGTHIIGAVDHHVCVNEALLSLNMDVDVASTKNLVERLSEVFLNCRLPHERSIPQNWIVYYIRGYSKSECMRSWVEEEGGRGLVQNYANTSGESITVRPTITDHQLAELVAFPTGVEGGSC